MHPLKNSILIVLTILCLAACTTEKQKESMAKANPPVPVASAPMPAPAPRPVAGALRPSATRAEMQNSKTYAGTKYASTFRPFSAPYKAEARSPASATPPSPPVTINQNDNPQTIVQRIDAYFSSLKSAAYTFNPPSPIRVAEPVTVHFWLDPQAAPAALAEELKKLVPQDGARVESGKTKWSPKMRATLSGSDFDVKAIDSEEQMISSTQRTTWSWDITPSHPGEKLALHLRLAVILPDEFGAPKTVTTLDREINVEVTQWWLFDHYFDKYWKWLLGGFGTVIVSFIAWWWKNRAQRVA